MSIWSKLSDRILFGPDMPDAKIEDVVGRWFINTNPQHTGHLDYVYVVEYSYTPPNGAPQYHRVQFYHEDGKALYGIGGIDKPHNLAHYQPRKDDERKAIKAVFR